MEKQEINYHGSDSYCMVNKSQDYVWFTYLKFCEVPGRSSSELYRLGLSKKYAFLFSLFEMSIDP